MSERLLDLTGIRVNSEAIICCNHHGIIARRRHSRRRGPFHVVCSECNSRSNPLPDPAVEFLRKAVVLFGTPKQSVFIKRGVLQEGSCSMNKNDVFPPTYFKAANLPEPITRKIVSATMEVMKNFHGQNERKLVIGFADEGRRLVMNRTNFDALAALHGPDTEQWLGKSVQLYADKIRVSGRSVDTVRVRAAV